jgi:hypothetical protein
MGFIDELHNSPFVAGVYMFRVVCIVKRFPGVFGNVVSYCRAEAWIYFVLYLTTLFR